MAERGGLIDARATPNLANCSLDSGSVAVNAPATVRSIVVSRFAFFLAAALCAAATPVTASPATEFFAAVRAHLDEAYYAKPGVDVAAIMDEVRRQLEATCAPLGDDCPLETGVEAARAALAALGDSHTRLDRAPASARGPGPRGPGGALVATSPMGWAVRQVRGGEALYVSWVAPDGPAARAGVRRHDVVLDPDGRTAAALGALNEPATIRLSRGGETLEVALTPEAGRGGPTPRLDRIGDIAVLQFPAGVGEGVAEAAHDLTTRAQAEGARAMILDLRDNGGGGVQCAAMASAFLDYEIVQTDRAGERRVLTVSPGRVRIVGGEEIEELSVERPTRWTGPLAILVNDNTGSCSEAVSIQASSAGRAIIVGEPSVGVGNNVIQPVPLPGGWRLLMTVAYSTTPNGEALPARPPLDVEVDDDPVVIARTGRDAVLEAAVEALAPKP